jgi:acetolactate synthase I/II/III large subunit
LTLVNYANFAIQQADVIISLGARFDDRVTGNLKCKSICSFAYIVSNSSFTVFAPEAVLAAKEDRGGIIHFGILIPF